MSPAPQGMRATQASDRRPKMLTVLLNAMVIGNWIILRVNRPSSVSLSSLKQELASARSLCWYANVVAPNIRRQHSSVPSPPAAFPPRVWGDDHVESWKTWESGDKPGSWDRLPIIAFSLPLEEPVPKSAPISLSLTQGHKQNSSSDSDRRPRSLGTAPRTGR
jgi:hypothetical protein